MYRDKQPRYGVGFSLFVCPVLGRTEKAAGFKVPRFFMKLIIFVCAVLLGTASFSQVLKLRAFQTCYVKTEVLRMAPCTFKEADILVVVNNDNNSFQVYSKEEINIDIIKKTAVVEEENGDVTYSYTGVDQKGRKCQVILMLYMDKNRYHRATIFITYEDYTFVYRLRIND